MVKKEIACSVVSERVVATLKKVLTIKFDKIPEYTIVCDQYDCQHVEENKPPCPLNLDMFEEELKEIEKKRQARFDVQKEWSDQLSLDRNMEFDVHLIVDKWFIKVCQDNGLNIKSETLNLCGYHAIELAKNILTYGKEGKITLGYKEKTIFFIAEDTGNGFTNPYYEVTRSRGGGRALLKLIQFADEFTIETKGIICKPCLDDTAILEECGKSDRICGSKVSFSKRITT